MNNETGSDAIAPADCNECLSIAGHTGEASAKQAWRSDRGPCEAIGGSKHHLLIGRFSHGDVAPHVPRDIVHHGAERQGARCPGAPIGGVQDLAIACRDPPVAASGDGPQGGRHTTGRVRPDDAVAGSTNYARLTDDGGAISIDENVVQVCEDTGLHLEERAASPGEKKLSPLTGDEPGAAFRGHCREVGGGESGMGDRPLVQRRQRVDDRWQRGRCGEGLWRRCKG